MKLIYRLSLFLGLVVFAYSANAALIVVDDFTGEDAQLEVSILNSSDLDSGVTVDVSFTALTANTGDITGVWLGLDESLFNPESILSSDIVLLGLPPTVSYSVTIGESMNLGGGVNLIGESGYALQFDLDLGLRQNDTRWPDIVRQLTFDIRTDGLMESYFDSAGVRLQSVNGSGSSKLAGGVVSVPEPAMIYLFGAGLVGFGLTRRKVKSQY